LVDVSTFVFPSGPTLSEHSERHCRRRPLICVGRLIFVLFLFLFRELPLATSLGDSSFFPFNPCMPLLFPGRLYIFSVVVVSRYTSPSRCWPYLLDFFPISSLAPLGQLALSPNRAFLLSCSVCSPRLCLESPRKFFSPDIARSTPLPHVLETVMPFDLQAGKTVFFQYGALWPLFVFGGGTPFFSSCRFFSCVSRPSFFFSFGFPQSARFHPALLLPAGCGLTPDTAFFCVSLLCLLPHFPT